VRLAHHDLCFGCGQTNLFGVMLDAERLADGSVAGRCFIKQDHQGPDAAFAHEGVVAAALGEAMALACGPGARATAISLQLVGSAPVGAFLDVQASVRDLAGGVARTQATAGCEGQRVASASGTYATGQAVGRS
jgi:acyl-coenzyme A thioesterase PaaI-like protein